MAVTESSIRARFPAFAATTTYPSGYVNLVLAEAERRVSPTWFGARRDDAVGYMTAHLLAITPVASSSPGGHDISSMSAGPVSLSFAVPQSGGAEMGSTPYGREFLALARVPGGIRAVHG